MEEQQNQKAPIWLSIICFLVPIVGLIMYATNTSKNKKYANGCGLPALIGFFVWPIISVLIIVLSILIGLSTFGMNKSITKTSYTSKTTTSSVVNEKSNIREAMELAQQNYKLESSTSSKKIDAKSIVRKHFSSYTILDTSNLSSSGNRLTGSIKIKTTKGNRYIVNFSTSTVKEN